MKRFSYYVSIFLLSVLAIGCTQDDYLHYNTESASLRFAYEAAGNDSIVYSFRLHPDVTEDLVEVPVQLIGLASSQPREISVEVLNDRSTAVENTDFVIETSEIQADSIKGVLKVTVKKTDALNQASRKFTLRLCANEYFEAAPINQSVFTIVLNNELMAPEGWIFGEYSQVKHEFVIKHTGVATDYYNKWSNSEKIWWKGKLINALYEYNLAHPGDPLKDENGILIAF